MRPVTSALCKHLDRQARVHIFTAIDEALGWRNEKLCRCRYRIGEVRQRSTTLAAERRISAHRAHKKSGRLVVGRLRQTKAGAKA